MKKFHNLPHEQVSVRLLSFFFFAGIIFHQIQFTKNIVISITDFFLLGANSLVFFYVWKKSGKTSLLIWSISSFLLTFIIEYVGVKTSVIFGDYHYGSTLIFQVGEVPVIIAFNWIILILSTYSISLKWTKKRWLAPLIGSLLIVLFDMVMEPVAMHLDYWQWKGNEIPAQNYVAWFIISLVFSSALSFFRINPDSRILRNYFFIQLLFFFAFRIFPVSA